MTLEESDALFKEKGRIRGEIWDNEFDECFNSDIVSLKEAAKGKAVSIFDNGEISSGIKEFLDDKPITAVRYQRLYEQNPAKAEIFITNMMEDYSVNDYLYDVKYQGQDYIDVLEHINALLEKNIKDVENGYIDRAMKYQYLFAMDDNTVSNNDNSQVHVSERVEYEPGKYANINYLKLYKPIGTGDNGTVLLKDKPFGRIQVSDKGCDIFGSSNPGLANWERSLKIMYFGTRYWGIS